MPAMW